MTLYIFVNKKWQGEIITCQNTTSSRLHIGRFKDILLASAWRVSCDAFSTFQVEKLFTSTPNSLQILSYLRCISGRNVVWWLNRLTKQWLKCAHVFWFYWAQPLLALNAWKIFGTSPFWILGMYDWKRSDVQQSKQNWITETMQNSRMTLFGAKFSSWILNLGLRAAISRFFLIWRCVKKERNFYTLNISVQRGKNWLYFVAPNAFLSEIFFNEMTKWTHEFFCQ